MGGSTNNLFLFLLLLLLLLQHTFPSCTENICIETELPGVFVMSTTTNPSYLLYIGGFYYLIMRHSKDPYEIHIKITKGLTMTDRCLTGKASVLPWVHLPKVAGGKALPIEDAAVPGGRWRFVARKGYDLSKQKWGFSCWRYFFVCGIWEFVTFQSATKNCCKSRFGNPGPRTKSQSWTKGKGWTNMRHDMSVCDVCLCFDMFISHRIS